MAWRKWVVRGLVFGVAAAIAAGGVAYQHWTDPAEVRRVVLAQFSAKFTGANVTVESARLRLLGGIAVSELRMTRRDDPDMANFLYVPSAVIYHDKEQLLAGKLAILKMELERPRLRVLRDGDGRWNLAGLLAEPDFKDRIPTLIIKQGTIVVEDRRASGAAPLEIKDVSLTVINDPDQTVTFEGSGVSDATGAVRLSGTWQRDSGDTALTCDAPAVPIGPSLIQRLSGVCPQLAEQARELSGSAGVHATLGHHPAAPRVWDHDVTITLAGGKFSHRELPLALEEITASLRCVNGHVERAEARGRAGAASVHVSVDDVTLPFDCTGPDCNVGELFRRLDVTIDNLPVSEWLIRRLPEKYRPLEKDFVPSGPINVRYAIWHDDKDRLRQRLTLLPQGMAASFEKFPYPLARITGSILHESCPGEPDRLTIDLVGRAGEEPVYIKAVLTGAKPDCTCAVDVWGKNLVLDDTLLKALVNPKINALAASFHPTGRADFQVHSDWRRDPSAPEGGRFDNRYVIKFHDAMVAYEPFPLKLDRVSGVLDIQPDHWEFRDFRASHGDGTFYTGGRSRREAGGKEWVEVAIAGRGVRLDDDLKKSLLKDETQRIWANFEPEGVIDFDGDIHIGPGEAKDALPDISLTVVPRGCRVTPRFFKYSLGDLRGKVRYEKGTVELENITARHGATKVALDRGVVRLKPGGGFLADLLYLHGDPLVTDADFVAALPPGLQKAVGALAVEGPLAVQTRLYIDAPADNEPPRIYWDGSATLGNERRGAALHTGVALEDVRGRIALRGWHDGRRIDGAAGNLDVKRVTLFNQPITNLRGEIVISDDEPDVLKFPGLLADYFGGQVYGPARVEFGPKLHYRLDLTAAQVKLEDFGRRNFNNTELQGLAVAQVYLEGDGGEVSGLKGNGRIDVPNGRMYNLPLLLDLVKFLGLRLPDRTAFEEAHVVFDIDGHRAHVSRLELYGNAISLRGSGDTNIDGSDLAFVFYLDWARLGQVLPAGVREIPREISNQLFRIDMRGKVGDLHFRKEPIPLLWDPVKRLFAGDEDGSWANPAKH